MLIRYESGQRGRYVFRGHEYLWDTTDETVKIVARGPADQEAIRDEDFLNDMVDNLLEELGIEEGDI